MNEQDKKELSEMFSIEKLIIAEEFTNDIINAINKGVSNKVPFVLLEGILTKELINLHRTAERRQKRDDIYD